MLAAAALLPAASAAALEIDWANNTGGRQKWKFVLNESQPRRVLCVHHKPLRWHAQLGLLELFAV